MAQTSLEIVHDYIHLVWDAQQTSLVRTLCADPIIRHDAEKLTRLSHDEQIIRIEAQADKELKFSDVILCAAEGYVTSVWNMTDATGTFRMSGIEIFRVTGGRITDVWNSTYVVGHWA